MPLSNLSHKKQILYQVVVVLQNRVLALETTVEGRKGTDVSLADGRGRLLVRRTWPLLLEACGDLRVVFQFF